MNKTELIDAIAEKAEISKLTAKNTIEAFTSTLTQVLSEGRDVNLIGFGRFYVAERSERLGVNPQTGKKIQIEAKIVPKFKPGSELSKAVDNQGKKK
ncbi:MAG: HU family DNA-binding protein [Flavobacteriales bacterium Tduv]